MLLLHCLPVLALFVSSVTSLNKERLEKSLGVNLEQRRLRLEKLGEHLESTDDVSVDKVKSTKTVKKDYLKGAETVVEINRKSGLAKYLFQADMHLNEEQLTHLENSLRNNKARFARSKRQAQRFSNQWIGGKVYYYFDSSINERKVISIKNSMAYLEDNTCIKFFENATAPNRIKFISNEEGCWSTVGMQGGEQELSIYDGCESMGTVVHEMMHALGYIHTQSRPDRNTYVQVNKENVQRNDWSNFVRYPEEEIITYTPYEYGSVMHYAADAFEISYETPTITSNDPKYMHTMGGDIISFWDIKMINDYYGCTGQCTARKSTKCLNDGVPNPNNCSKCICPLGYGGDLCQEKPAGCGSTLEAATTWKTETIRVGNASNRYDVRDEFMFCNYWITAPKNGKIQVRLSSDMINSQCRYGCSVNGIEFKVNKDKQETNPRFCCSSEAYGTLTSELNPLPVIAYNRHYVNEFTIFYRYVPEQTSITTKLPVKPTTTASTVPPKTKATITSTPKPTTTTKIITTTTTKLPQKPTMQPTPLEPVCSDVWDTDLCERLLENVACDYRDVAQKCLKTCGVCSKQLITVDPNICENKWNDSDCEGLARIGMCTHFEDKCHKSCYQCE